MPLILNKLNYIDDNTFHMNKLILIVLINVLFKKPMTLFTKVGGRMEIKREGPHERPWWLAGG